jgi:hypothetical protein
MNIVFEKPIFKKKYYVSHLKDSIFYDMTDVTIKNITRLGCDNGHSVNISINSDQMTFFTNIDNISMNNLKANNAIWFNNGLSEEELISMFQQSYCEQNECINAILPDDTDSKLRIYLNNKKYTLQDFLSLLRDVKVSKHHIFNIQLQHIGMYIYTRQTINKWAIRKINIYTDNDIDIDAREDIEEFWKMNITECDNVLKSRIKLIEDKRFELQNAYQSIIQERSPKLWEKKVQDLSKLVKNIL